MTGWYSRPALRYNLQQRYVGRRNISGFINFAVMCRQEGVAGPDICRNDLVSSSPVEEKGEGNRTALQRVRRKVKLSSGEYDRGLCMEII